MPTFDFRCENGHTFEALVARDALPPCPDCGAETRKLPAIFAFSLKGTGWARDNYGLKKG